MCVVILRVLKDSLCLSMHSRSRFHNFTSQMLNVQAAAVAALPLPERLEALVASFEVLTAVYGFLLRQHIQVGV